MLLFHRWQNVRNDILPAEYISSVSIQVSIRQRYSGNRDCIPNRAADFSFVFRSADAWPAKFQPAVRRTGSLYLGHQLTNCPHVDCYRSAARYCPNKCCLKNSIRFFAAAGESPEPWPPTEKKQERKEIGEFACTDPHIKPQTHRHLRWHRATLRITTIVEISQHGTQQTVGNVTIMTWKNCKPWDAQT